MDEAGVVQPAVLAEALSADPDGVALVTVMWANNEVGVVQPIGLELAALAREHGIPFQPTPCRRPASCRWTSRPAARTR